MDLLDRMLGHDEWTTTRLLEFCSELTEGQLDQSFDIGHETVRATLDHMIFNVDAWKLEMIGKPIEVQRDDLSIGALVERHNRSYSEFAALARQLQNERRLDDTFKDDYGVTQTFGGTILHVVLHNTLHRSEVQHMLKRLGKTYPLDGDPQEWEYHLRESDQSLGTAAAGG